MSAAHGSTARDPHGPEDDHAIRQERTQELIRRAGQAGRAHIEDVALPAEVIDECANGWKRQRKPHRTQRDEGDGNSRRKPRFE